MKFKKAKKMFRSIGFKETDRNKSMIRYEISDGNIQGNVEFCILDRNFTIVANNECNKYLFSKATLMAFTEAIHQQAIELGWIDEFIDHKSTSSRNNLILEEYYELVKYNEELEERLKRAEAAKIRWINRYSRLLDALDKACAKLETFDCLYGDLKQASEWKREFLGGKYE